MLPSLNRSAPQSELVRRRFERSICNFMAKETWYQDNQFVDMGLQNYIVEVACFASSSFRKP